MKKKVLKIAAFVVAVLLIIGVCIFANSLVGNPISMALAKNTAKKHMVENYGDTDYVLEDVNYSFKDGYYHAYVSSPGSADTHFTLIINGFGKLMFDYYENNVTNGWNTAKRIENDYRKAVKAIVESSACPININIGFGELVFTTEEYKDVPEMPDYALITNDLVPDAYYDLNDLGAKAGKLTLYLEDSTVTVERMAELLLEIREYFDNAGLSFHAIDCVLEYSADENGFVDDGRVEVMDFLYSDIYEEGLTERVSSADKAAKEYYDVQDAEKLVLVETAMNDE